MKFCFSRSKRCHSSLAPWPHGTCTLALKFNNFILWMFDGIPEKKCATLEQKTHNCNPPKTRLKNIYSSMMSVTLWISLANYNITNTAMKKNWPFEDVQCTYSLVNMGIFHCHISLPECKQKLAKDLWSSSVFCLFWTLPTWYGRSSEGGRRVTVLTKVGPSSTQRSCRRRK